MSDVIARLRLIKPDVCIEFRQSYVGPLMRKYGNMFRAGDCPNDAVTNRVRTIDIRLLCGSTAAHADMLMWHRDDPVEAAALQVLNILFAVPQISVLLDAVPPGHVEMLRFWLGFWREHRDVLLDGELDPRSPVALYPVVAASTAAKRILAVYDNAVAAAGPDVPDELYVVNATRAGRVVLELAEPAGVQTMRTFDCRGNEVAKQRVRLAAGPHSILVPPAGLVSLRR
jgi:alpha-galactosidase